ncbi:MAG: glycosyltransferase family 39 protein [Gemmataceae bacterium]
MDGACSPSCLSSRWSRAAGLLILAAAAGRLLWLIFWCPFDLAPDEAHYWDWSRHLDWSYYSKGPLVALLIRAGCWLFGDLSVALTGSEMVAVRIPAILCGSLLLWGLYRLTVDVHGNSKWGFSVVLLALTLPILSAGASLMTIDAPYTAAWVWALVFVHRALFMSRSMPDWILAGLCVAVGVLAKHTMVLFVPMVGLFLLTRPNERSEPSEDADAPRCSEPGLNGAGRRELLRPGFWTMTLLGALGGLPILFWNMNNGWVTLAHTRGHVGLQHGPAIHWLGPLHYLALQFALLLGYWFVAWAAAVWHYRPGRAGGAFAYLWWMSVPMFVFFALFSFKNGGGEANWPVAAYIAGMALIVPYLARIFASPRPMVRYASLAFVVFFALFGVALSIVVHDSRLIRPFLARFAQAPTDAEPTPLRRFDPTCRLKGWHTLARELGVLSDELRAQGVEPILASGHWGLPGEIAFYTPGHPVVYCLGSRLGDRHSQYDLWRPNPIDDVERYKGRTFIMVGVAEYQVLNVFDRVEQGRRIYYNEDGQPIAFWYVTIGHGFRGLPERVGPDTY